MIFLLHYLVESSTNGGFVEGYCFTSVVSDLKWNKLNLEFYSVIGAISQVQLQTDLLTIADVIFQTIENETDVQYLEDQGPSSTSPHWIVIFDEMLKNIGLFLGFESWNSQPLGKQKSNLLTRLNMWV